MKHIYYKQLNRYCLPYYDCEPDNEIQPCTMNSTRDICSPCVRGMVQPDLISSPVNGDTSVTACFKPETDCLAEGIIKNMTYKRILKNDDKGFCDNLYGCKCKTTACFYGDPCLCDDKRGGCPPGTTLNEAGECIPCPNGTYKNDNGCGPCRHLQSNHIAKPTTHNTRTVNTYISLPTPVHIHPNRPEENDNLLVILMIALGVLTVLFSMVTIAICFKRSGFMLTGICWTHVGREQHDNTDRIQIEPLVKVTNQDDNVIIRNAEGRILTDNPAGDARPQYLLYSFQSRQHADVMSIPYDSGFHAQNIIIAAGNNKWDDCNKSRNSNSNYNNTYRQTSEQQLTDVDELPKYTNTSSTNEMKIEMKWKNKMRKPLAIDIPVRNPNDSFNVSDTCSPVTTDSEPHTLWTGSCRQVHQSDTSGYETQCNDETLPSTFAASGDYMSMNVSTLNSSNNNETILSNLENFNFGIKGLNMNTLNSMSGQSETEIKHCGPNSIDSGVSLTYKHPDI
ncbi:Hypothetical predicted protein [Mytilus galloprovincialis]|uniref:Uncharacterized protein n=1 Tax=Mytilus galloprovincialis TaxID=29158 RepID=A0A8B6F905_MYTGA|nr:Hypothetical predicted protein [Mytilus galloprovincialis]